jgi:lipopolysaccharide/colanic/teichoic acid biosynthesis glycosyltransferase
LGPPSELEAVIEEFTVHGIQTDQVVIGMNSEDLPEGVIEEIRRVCGHHNIDLGFVPEMFGLTTMPEPEALTKMQTDFEASVVAEPPVEVPAYFKLKRYLDFGAALVLLTVLSPFWLVAAVVAVYDVGMPVFFWQQRMGIGSRRFLLYKFRTLRTPFDETGRKLSDEERLSPIGRFMRRSRLDELPQLLNILVGDMSLIGPRPLLPRDQPKNLAMRLTVRPGITGWAQVNGGVLLTPDEKEWLDDYYVRNASLWLDLRIALMTVLMFFHGDRRSQLVESAWTNVPQINPARTWRPVTQWPFTTIRLAPRVKEHASTAQL